MKILFLTLVSVCQAVDKKLYSIETWRSSLFFLDWGQEVCLGESQWIAEMLEEAEKQNRLAWRPVWPPANAIEIQGLLSKLLQANGLEPLNHNLPPIVDPQFLKIAVERVNNKQVVQVEALA